MRAARIVERDYRDLEGQFDKIASVGMFEHVGLRRAPEYFRKIAELLAPGGLFLNHAIPRAQPVSDDAASLFVRRRIFRGTASFTWAKPSGWPKTRASKCST